jgi:hypothetical protein
MAKKPVASGKTEEAVQAPAASVEAKTPDVVIPEPTPTVAPVVAKGAPVGSKAEQMRQYLASQPKVRVLIPLASGEKPGVTQSVILNGYSMYIRKGDYVEVPEEVAKVLDVKLKHKLSIESHPMRVTADKPVQMDQFGS